MFDTLSICVATIFVLVANFSTKRIPMLAYSLLCCLTYLIYWSVAGQMTALAMTVASVLGIAVQLATPRHLLEPSRPYRIIFALVLATVGFLVSYKTPLDIVPLLGFVIGRFSETLTKPVSIRSGFMLSASMWLLFAVLAHDPRAILANVICISGQIYSNCRDLNLLPKFEKKSIQPA